MSFKQTTDRSDWGTSAPFPAAATPTKTNGFRKAEESFVPFNQGTLNVQGTWDPAAILESKRAVKAKEAEAAEAVEAAEIAEGEMAEAEDGADAGETWRDDLGGWAVDSHYV